MHHHKFAIVISDFNLDITSKLLKTAEDRLVACGLNDTVVYHVPGAIEIPYVVQNLASTKQFSAIITLGAVIRGETGHYDLVCDQVNQGLMQIMLEYNIPIIFGVLTTDNKLQAQQRIDGTKCYKGHEVVDAAIHMSNLSQHFIAAVQV